MREVLSNDSLFARRKFCVCDCYIDRISLDEDTVTFHFSEGFSLIEGETIYHTQSGQVRILGVSSADISCWIIKRRATKQGAKQYGKPVEVEKLLQMMERKKLRIELFVEMYDAYRFHWRGSFFPCGRRRLSTLVVFEVTDEFALEYTWR